MKQTEAVKERPILFSGPMVRAILEGRKTQTRRVITPQPTKSFQFMPLSTELVGIGSPEKGWKRSPYGVPGDRLWIREAVKLRSTGPALGEFSIIYRADEGMGGEVRDFIRPDYGGNVKGTRWTPSLHMPRWASRITLEIVGVHVERVQEISEKDAKAEGASDEIPFDKNLWSPYRHGFYTLWNSINAKRGYGWEKNPWVWVVEFRRIKSECL